MTPSRNNASAKAVKSAWQGKVAALVCVSAIFALMVPPLARAQEAQQEAPRGPVQLIPQNLPEVPEGSEAPGESDAGAAAPLSLYPGGAAPKAPSLPPRQISPRPGALESGIEVGVLGDVGEASIGLLTEDQGGLGARMWQGTSRREVERLLPELPAPLFQPSLHDLQYRLLLSSAAPPQGATAGQSILYLRLERLMAGGESEAVRRLFAGRERVKADAGSAKLRAEAFLAAGDVKEACRSLDLLPVGSDPLGDPLAAFSLKLTALCQAEAGEVIAANLTADLAREQGMEDALFYSLLAQKTDGLKLDAPAPERLSPLDYALYLGAGRALPADAVSLAEPSLLADMMRRDGLDMGLRIQAGEKAVAAYLADPHELAALYGSADLPKEADEAWQARAALYKTLSDENVPGDKAMLVSEGLAAAATTDDFRMLARVLGPIIASIPPRGADPVLGGHFVRALIINEERVRASMWLSALSEAGHRTPQLDELKGMVRFLTGKRGVEPDLAAASTELKLRIGEGGRVRAVAAREALLLDALGYQLSPDLWAALLDSGELPDGLMPGPQLLRALEEASAAGRRGEAVLFTLALPGKTGLGNLHPQALANMVSALLKVGLREEAFRLALDALLAASEAGRVPPA
jgi:hypothetical protein